MKELKLYYSIILLLLLSHLSVRAQENRIEIALIDTLRYTSFNTAHIPDARYPVTNLFDGKLNTCWVSRLGDEYKSATVFIGLPNYIRDVPVIKIHNGYWKSEKLYRQNARIRKLKVTPYYGIIADGFVTENGYMSFAHRLSEAQEIELKDTMSLQSYALSSLNVSSRRLDSLKKSFEADMGMPILTTVKFIEIEILEAYQGSRYPDICVSEIYFNDCFFGAKPDPKISYHEVYLNADENAILAKTAQDSTRVLYADNNAILQIRQISSDLRWAILMKVPVAIEGRVETSYELLDLALGKLVTGELQVQVKDLNTVNDMYFEEKHGQLTLVQSQYDNEIRVILREIH